MSADRVVAPSEQAFTVDAPCPLCGQRSIIGLMLVDQERRHMHTHYYCTFWRSGLDDGGRPLHQRCGWDGSSVPVAEVGKLIRMRRSGEQQVNAWTTHGVFATNEEADRYAQKLGWKLGTYDVLAIALREDG